jgi:hypothetical protein
VQFENITDRFSYSLGNNSKSFEPADITAILRSAVRLREEGVAISTIRKSMVQLFIGDINTVSIYSRSFCYKSEICMTNVVMPTRRISNEMMPRIAV